MKTTDWKIFEERGQAHRIRVKYGVDEDFARRHNQEGHFSITYECYRSERGFWAEDSFGAGSETIAKHFPELAPLLQWHLCGVERGPMHYEANAMFWFDQAAGYRARGKYDRGDPLDHFKSTMVYGALPDDAAHDFAERHPSVWKRQEIQEWLAERLPALMAAFRAAMAEAGVSWTEREQNAVVR